MRKKSRYFYSLFVIGLFLTNITFGQNNKIDCSKALVQAQIHLDKNELNNALKQLQQAEICDTYNKFIKQRQSMQNKIFAALEKQKEDAEAKEQCEELRKESEQLNMILKEMYGWMELKQRINKRADNFEESLTEVEVNNRLISIYSKYLEVDSTDYKSWLDMYYVYQKVDKSENEQLNIINKCIELNPKSPLIYLQRGSNYYELDEYDKAINDAITALDLNPMYTHANDLLGRARAMLNNKKGANEAFNNALELNPNYSFLHSSIGFMHIRENAYEDAIISANKAIASNKENENAYRVLGNVYYSKKEYDKALTFYSMSLEINPKSKESYTERGYVNWKMKDYNNGMSDYNKALDLDSTYAAAYNGIGILHDDQERYNSALIYYDKAIKYDSIAIYFNNRANVYYSIEKFDYAKKDYQNAIALDPTYLGAYNGLGLVHRRQKNYREALEIYDKALKIDSEYMLAHLNKGIVYDAVRNYQSAILSYNKAISLDRDNALAYQLRGSAYNAIKKYQLAISDYKKMHEIDPKKNLDYRIDQMEAILKETEINLDDLDPENLSSSPLSFYPGYFLVEYEKYDQLKSMSQFRYFISDTTLDTIIIVLDGDNEAIYKANVDLAIALTDQNVNDYVDFYFKCVQGRHGGFNIINKVDEIVWSDALITEADIARTKKNVNAALNFVSNQIWSDNDGWVIEKLMNFKNSLFTSTVRVARNGQITLYNDKLIYEEWQLPSKLWVVDGTHYNYQDPYNRTVGYVENTTSHENDKYNHFETSELSFYPGFYLEKREINTKKAPGEHHEYFIWNNSLTTVVSSLNSTSLPIHQLNEEIPIQLNTANVAEYLEFFSTHVHGEDGAFQIIESTKDLVWDSSKSTDEIEKTIDLVQSTLDQVSINIAEENGYWIIQKLVHYGHTLFKADFKIESNGMVTMTNDEIIASDLPTKVLIRTASYYEFVTLLK